MSSKKSDRNKLLKDPNIKNIIDTLKGVFRNNKNKDSNYHKKNDKEIKR